MSLADKYRTRNTCLDCGGVIHSNGDCQGCAAQYEPITKEELVETVEELTKEVARLKLENTTLRHHLSPKCEGAD